MDTIKSIAIFLYEVLMPPKDLTGTKAYWWSVRMALTSATTLVSLVTFIMLSFGVFGTVLGFSGFAAESKMDHTDGQVTNVRAEIIEGQIWDLNQKQCDLRGNLPAQYMMARMIAEKQEKFRYLKGYYATVIPCTP